MLSVFGMPLPCRMQSVHLSTVLVILALCVSLSLETSRNVLNRGCYKSMPLFLRYHFGAPDPSLVEYIGGYMTIAHEHSFGYCLVGIIQENTMSRHEAIDVCYDLNPLTQVLSAFPVSAPFCLPHFNASHDSTHNMPMLKEVKKDKIFAVNMALQVQNSTLTGLRCNITKKRKDVIYKITPEDCIFVDDNGACYTRETTQSSCKPKHQINQTKNGAPCIVWSDLTEAMYKGYEAGCICSSKPNPENATSVPWCFYNGTTAGQKLSSVAVTNAQVTDASSISESANTTSANYSSSITVVSSTPAADTELYWDYCYDNCTDDVPDSLAPLLQAQGFSVQHGNPVIDGTNIALKRKDKGWEILEENTLTNSSWNALCLIAVCKVDYKKMREEHISLKFVADENGTLKDVPTNDPTYDILMIPWYTEVTLQCTQAKEHTEVVMCSIGGSFDYYTIKDECFEAVKTTTTSSTTTSTSTTVKKTTTRIPETTLDSSEVDGLLALYIVGSLLAVLLFLVCVVIATIKILGWMEPPPDLTLSRADHEAMMRKPKMLRSYSARSDSSEGTTTTSILTDGTDKTPVKDESNSRSKASDKEDFSKSCESETGGGSSRSSSVLSETSKSTAGNSMKSSSRRDSKRNL